MRIIKTKLQTNKYWVYDYGDYEVEFDRTKPETEFWLTKKGYTVKTYMFGCKTDSLDQCITLIQDNIEDYIKIDWEEKYGNKL